MKDMNKTKPQLSIEIAELKKRIAGLEKEFVTLKQSDELLQTDL